MASPAGTDTCEPGARPVQQEWAKCPVKSMSARLLTVDLRMRQWEAPDFDALEGPPQLFPRLVSGAHCCLFDALHIQVVLQVEHYLLYLSRAMFLEIAGDIHEVSEHAGPLAERKVQLVRRVLQDQELLQDLGLPRGALPVEDDHLQEDEETTWKGEEIVATNSCFVRLRLLSTRVGDQQVYRRE